MRKLQLIHKIVAAHTPNHVLQVIHAHTPNHVLQVIHAHTPNHVLQVIYANHLSSKPYNVYRLLRDERPKFSQSRKFTPFGGDIYKNLAHVFCEPVSPLQERCFFVFVRHFFFRLPLYLGLEGILNSRQNTHIRHPSLTGGQEFTEHVCKMSACMSNEQKTA